MDKENIIHSAATTTSTAIAKAAGGGEGASRLLLDNSVALKSSAFTLVTTDTSSLTINHNNNNNYYKEEEEGDVLHNHHVSSNSDGLYEVIEAAEATIKQQVEENTRLKTELRKKTQLLEIINSDKQPAQLLSTSQWHNRAEGLNGACIQNSRVVNEGDVFRGTDRVPRNEPSGTIDHDPKRNSDDFAVQSHAESQSEFSRMNGGTVKGLSGHRRPVDNAVYSQFSPPSTASSPSWHQVEGELEQPGHGLVPMAGFSNSSLWKQTCEHEEEILLLRRHLADYSIKEAQLQNEKHLLEKRIAYMRTGFDHQQQELVDAASKALSYRQDIIEENIRLTYALQASQQDTFTFVSYLMPLLADYSLQPPVSDAQSIVSNLKVLFKHFQEKLILTEGKLKESQYQLAPWRSDVNSSSNHPQSLSYPNGVAVTSQNNGLELMAQPNVPITFPSPQTTSDSDMLGNHQGAAVGDRAGKNLEVDEIASYSPLASRNSEPLGVPTQRPVMHDQSQLARYNAETAPKQVTFDDTVSSAELDYLDFDGRRHERGEPSANWSSKSSPYSTTMDDPASYSPYLPPVQEEPSSSFSEAGEDDPFPAIEGLQISGDPFPGRELQACGISINGTTSCNFEWVRFLEDGSVSSIDGATQPNHLITADDVDTYLAIEVQPLDNRKRKGKSVRVVANEHRKISCDPEMQNAIEKALYYGQASYSVSLSIGYLGIWEPATLVVKRDGYKIKRSRPRGGSIADKFGSTMSVTIPYGQASEFTITSTGGVDRILRAENHPTDFGCSRDTIVLVLRLFIKRAGEKKKTTMKKGLFFH